MECHASCHGAVVVADHHVPVHLFVDQTEDDGLVAHERLVVAFAVAYCLFVVAPVGEFPVDGCGMPVLVTFFLYYPDPVVWDSHGQTVVESHSPSSKLEARPGIPLISSAMVMA